MKGARGIHGAGQARGVRLAAPAEHWLRVHSAADAAPIAAGLVGNSMVAGCPLLEYPTTPSLTFGHFFAG